MGLVCRLHAGPYGLRGAQPSVETGWSHWNQIGDFGAVALFGNEQFRTLPFYLYQQIGSYRSQDGAVTALLLLLLCFLLFTVIEKLPGRDVKTE